MNGPLVDLIIEAEDWQTALPTLAQEAEGGAQIALQGAGVTPEAYSISLLACDDDRIAALNRSFRGRDTPTNVLSWPAFQLAAAAPGAEPTKPPHAPHSGRTPLGDVAIALQTCAREATSSAIPLKNHVTHLIVHGCLHLLGYDHQTQADAEVMEGLERRMLREIGIPDPYA